MRPQTNGAREFLILACQCETGGGRPGELPRDVAAPGKGRGAGSVGGEHINRLFKGARARPAHSCCAGE